MSIEMKEKLFVRFCVGGIMLGIIALIMGIYQDYFATIIGLNMITNL